MTSEEFEKAIQEARSEGWDRGYADCADDLFRDAELVKRGSRLAEGSPNPFKAPADGC